MPGEPPPAVAGATCMQWQKTDPPAAGWVTYRQKNWRHQCWAAAACGQSGGGARAARRGLPVLRLRQSACRSGTAEWYYAALLCQWTLVRTPGWSHLRPQLSRAIEYWVRLPHLGLESTTSRLPTQHHAHSTNWPHVRQGTLKGWGREQHQGQKEEDNLHVVCLYEKPDKQYRTLCRLYITLSQCALERIVPSCRRCNIIALWLVRATGEVPAASATARTVVQPPKLAHCNLHKGLNLSHLRQF